MFHRRYNIGLNFSLFWIIHFWRGQNADTSRNYLRKITMADSTIGSESSSSNAPLNSILVDSSSNDAEHSTRFALDLRNLKSLPEASNSSNGKIRRHRLVVRSQSSSISLLRQPPPSASSITSGTDESQHFRMPEPYYIILITRAHFLFDFI